MEKPSKKFYDRMVERLDRLDPSSLQLYLLRLLQEKGFLERIFNSLREGIIVIDNTLRIRIINTAALNLFGIKENAVGQYISKYFKQFAWDELLQVAPENWGRFSRRELEVFYPERRLLSFYLMPVAERPDMNKRGLPLATLIFHDVTETFQATEQTVETQKVKAITQLAAGVAHELGNPLNSLSIQLQILRRQLRQQPESISSAVIDDFVDIAGQEIARLDAIVKNFLTAVRPGQLELSALDLRKLLSAAIGFMRPEIESKGIQVEVAFPDTIPVLTGDAGQLTQAFFNIIKNAIQAMPDGGLLQILCIVDDIYVQVKFTDTGKGLSDQEISRIMEPYFTTKSGGTGLGLLIVDRIVRAHGGELTIEGSPGQGASFSISLPRHARIIRQIPRESSATEMPETN